MILKEYTYKYQISPIKMTAQVLVNTYNSSKEEQNDGLIYCIDNIDPEGMRLVEPTLPALGVELGLGEQHLRWRILIINTNNNRRD